MYLEKIVPDFNSRKENIFFLIIVCFVCVNGKILRIGRHTQKCYTYKLDHIQIEDRTIRRQER